MTSLDMGHLADDDVMAHTSSTKPARTTSLRLLHIGISSPFDLLSTVLAYLLNMSYASVAAQNAPPPSQQVRGVLL